MKIKRKKHEAQINQAYKAGIEVGNRNASNLYGPKLQRLDDRVHELEHTPEIKADTEAAFSRGISHGKLLARSVIMTALTQMDTGGTSPLPVPEIKPKISPLGKPPGTQARESSGMRDPAAAE